MSSVLDQVFIEVCLDERVSDGIFRMDETEHMNALRDYFVKRGIAKEEAVHITNRMVEGKYPERQAYRKEDGILVTWPSQKHKHKAMHENPGKYVEQNPFPKKDSAPPKEKFDKKEYTPLDKDTGDDEELDNSEEKPPGNNLFNTSGIDQSNSNIQQGDKNLSVEPIAGIGQPVQASPPTIAQIPRTPARISAEKEIAKQIVKTDDTALTNVSNPLTENFRQQIIKELYTKADELGLKEVVTFLTPYVKS